MIRLLDRWRFWIVSRTSFVRLLLVFLAGSITSLAHAPVFAFPLLWVTFPLLVWLLDCVFENNLEQQKGGSARVRAFFGYGWVFGFGYFLSGLWWIGSAFLVEAERTILLFIMPFAMMALPAVLALFWGFAVAFAATVWRQGWPRLVALAFSLAVFEWLRSWIFTGFPWNHLGYVLSGNDSLAQSLSVLDPAFLAFFSICLFSLPVIIVEKTTFQRSFIALVLVAVIAQYTYGFHRLHSFSYKDNRNVVLHLIQPNIRQHKKWDPVYKHENIETLMALTQQAADRISPDLDQALIIWPESAIPVLLEYDKPLLARIGEILPENALLVAGSNALIAGKDRQLNYHNSILTINSEGEVIDRYNKVKLVPFGEYVPLKTILLRFGITPIVGAAEFVAGTRSHGVDLGAAGRMWPSICYEAIFPLAGLDDNLDANWILNVTNDDWYAGTPGPYQHAHHARLRAIISNRPLVRVANSGLSALFDETGQARALSKFDTQKIISVFLPIFSEKQ